MKSSYTCALLCFALLLTFSPAAPAQNPFFVPPTYPGSGQTVTADFNRDGKPDLISSDGTVLLGKGDGTFTVGTPINVTGLNPNLIATADFNGDGKPDLVFAAATTNTFSVFLGNGDGTFQAPIVTTVAAPLSFLAAADLNGDGKPDVLVVPSVSPSLTTYLGNGNGTFATGVMAGATTGGQLADFNADGKLDLVVAGGVQLGNGNGTFQSLLTFPSGSLGGQVIGDFNGDGKLDLAGYTTATNLAPAQIQILFGNGDGTFHAAPVQVLTTEGLFGPPSSVVAVAADLNKDGKADLILENFPFLQVFTSNGDGTFTAGTTIYNTMTQYTVQEPPTVPYVVVADFNNDGNLDVAANNVFLSGNGNGTLHGNPALPKISGTVAADFNKDGKPDVAVLAGGSQTVTIYLNDGNDGFTSANTYSVPLPMLSNSGLSAAVDLNGDGNIDLVGYDWTAGSWSLFVLLGKGDGSFGSPTIIPGLGPGSLSSVMVADINGDNKPDLIVVAGSFVSTQGSVFVFLGNGDGTFAAPVQYFAGNANGIPAIADFNNDGKLDVAVASTPSVGAPLAIALLLGNGDGTFQPVTYISTPYAGNLLAADLNGDGNVDLVSGTVFLGHGDGTFTPLAPFSDVSGVYQVVDFNGDGKLDLLATSSSGLELELLLGNGDGTFGNPLPLGTNGFPLVADFNGDARPDIAFDIASGNTFGLTLLLNESGPATPDFLIAATAPKPATLAPGDSATSKVTLTSVGGFNAGVTLTCSGLPSGATCSFSPPSIVNASGVSTLTIATTTSTPMGTYPITIVGSSSVVHDRVITLTIATSTGATTVSLSPASLTFAQQATGTTSAAQTATLTNTGTAALTISGISLAGTNATDFAQTNACGASLAPGATCQISITFTPTGMGARTASLSVSDNATGSPQMIALAGAGPDFSVTPATSTSTVSPGNTATYSISIAPAAGFAQSVALTCTGAPALSTCTVSPASLNLSGVAQTATVSVTTTAAVAALVYPGDNNPLGKINARVIALAFALLAICMLIVSFLRAQKIAVFLSIRRTRVRYAPIALGLLLCAALALTSCGGSSGGNSGGGGTGSPGTAAGTYTLTVTATSTSGSATLTHTTKLTLVVQ
jgi:FG-GAP-like repeat/Abnormal spindle-like microcephaly-assoc'd, ASPM-SPD-2-Hydin